ncbi:MAG TPA: hypothetical protein VGD81_16215, partial [Opitutaceae bacterium]
MTRLRPTADSAAPRNRFRCRLLLPAALCLALPCLLTAQAPAPSTSEPQTADAEVGNETITLSLFEVRADQ